MRTAGDICQRALVRANIVASGETPTAAEIEDAATTLGDMLDSWSLERLIVFGTQEVVIPATGAARYTLGPTGDIVTTRPDAVTSAFRRPSSGQVGDEPLLQASPEFMDAIGLKDDASCPHWYSYEDAMPDGVLRVWPVPSDGAIHIRITTPVLQITDINDELVLPPGWFDAMVTNLAMRLCGEYGQLVTDALAGQAQQAKANIKRANLQPAMATFDPALTARRDRGYEGFYYGR